MLLSKIVLVSIFSLMLLGCNNPNIPIDNEDDPIITINDSVNHYLIDYEPSWSLNGNWIVYVHRDSTRENSGLYIIKSDGSQKQMILQSETARTPEWSPLSNKITFEMDGQIFIIDIDTEQISQLTFTNRNFFPSWNSEGNWIYYDTNKDNSELTHTIWKMRIDGNEKKKVGSDPTSKTLRMPYVSKVGDVIVHWRQYNVEGQDIFLMDSLGQNVQRITNNNFIEWHPKISNDLQNIIYSKGEETGYQIWLLDLTSMNVRKITSDNGWNGAWSPNGDRIVYTKSDTTCGLLYIMNKEGTNKQQLTF